MVIKGGYSLVGVLKGKIASLEETNARLQAQVGAQNSDYEE